MIVDTLQNANAYKLIHKNFATAFDFLQKTDLTSLPVGKTAIDGNNVIVNINDYTTKPLTEAKWEAHITYADIQMVISGEELIGYTPIEMLTVTEKYNKEKDILFLDGQGEYINMHSGKFAIFLHTMRINLVFRKTMQFKYVKW